MTNLALAALWLVVLGQIVLGERLWEGDFSMYYTGFTIAAKGERNQLYEPHVQREVQQRILDTSAARSDRLVSRAYKDGWLPYNYPPHLTLLGAWLAYLPLDAVLLGWTAVQLGLIGILIGLLLRFACHWNRGERFFLVSAILAFVPWLRTLQYGQLTLVVLILVCLLYGALRRGRDGRAGVYWLLGTIKPQLVLMPGIAMAVELRWRALLIMAVFGGLWFLATGLWLGFDVWLGFLEMVVRVVGFVGRYGFRPDEMYNLRGLLTWAVGEEHMAWSNALATAGLFLAAIASAAIWWRQRGAHGPSFPLAFGLTVMLGMIFSPHFYVQDSLLSILPAGLLYDHLRSQRPQAVFGFAAATMLGIGAFVLDIFQTRAVGLPRLPTLWLFGLTLWLFVEWLRQRRREVSPALSGA